MFIAYIIVAILVSAMLVSSAITKLRRNPSVVHSIHEVAKVPLSWLPWLAACEIAAAVGLLIGIFWWPLGVAAAIGIIIYFIGACTAHIRAKDFKGLSAPVVIALVAIAILVLRLLSQ
jgi:hypothetical protein